MDGGRLELEEVPTPIGVLEVAAGPSGVAWVRLPSASLPSRIVVAGRDPADDEAGSSAGGDPASVARLAAREISEYFAGSRREFTVPVDLATVGAFQRRVLEAAARIPFGETASYAEMAIAAGSPGAVRAAGTAMGANPVPILIPCHRVIRSDGTPGLYGGGEEVKLRLLEFEGWGVEEPASR